MKTKLSDKEMDLIEDVSDLTSTDYEIKDNEVSVDDCLRIIENLKDEYMLLKEEFESKDNEENEDEEPDRYEDYLLGLL